MNILVLNADYQPLNITTFRRGFNLVYKGKAEVVEYDKELDVVTETTYHKRPLVIRLIRYVYIKFKKVPLSRTNVYRRDGHKCAYCASVDNLTLDHIIPKSRGGQNSWENLVTCCKRCNSIKDDRTPKEANMKLLVKPYKPTFSQFIDGMKGGMRETWGNYIN